MKTVLAHFICKNIEGLQWIVPFFEYHHDHKHSSTASNRSTIHVDPPKALDEKKLTDMTVILQELQDRYLILMSERLTEENKKKFLQCKKNV